MSPAGLGPENERAGEGYLLLLLLLGVFFSGVRLTSPGTAATSGLLYSPRRMMRVIVEQLVE
jgi:hypothetical protein